MDLHLLAEPFPPEDIEFRVQQAGKKGERVWALVLAYVTARAIMERFDEVCGPENWRNEFKAGPDGGIVCGLSVRVQRGSDAEWVTKWDGAENTDVEAVKGGLSGAMKRAGVQWGVGRYLYLLEETFANVHPEGSYRGRLSEKHGGDSFKWDPPQLPKWALPGGSGKPTGESAAAKAHNEEHDAALAFIKDVGARCEDDVLLTLDGGEPQPLKEAVRKAWPRLKRERAAAQAFARAIEESTGQTFNL